MVADDALLAFCHVAMLGGTTLAHLLRRHYGLTHVDVASRVLRTWQPARAGSTAHPYVYGPCVSKEPPVT